MRFRRNRAAAVVDDSSQLVVGSRSHGDGGLRLPRHRGTTAHVASIYPFHGGPALAELDGPFVGINVTDGHAAWCFDPFRLYGRDLGAGAVLTNSNMLILGEPGAGKSSAVKTMLYRQAAYWGRRRFLSISDPKGEYGPLAAALGMPVIKLYPGGSDRLNPLDPGPGERVQSLMNRQVLMGGMLALVIGRALDAIEEALLSRAIDVVDDAHRTRAATLVDLATLLGDLPDRVLGINELALLSDHELAGAVTTIRLALAKLLAHSLRGMFDAASTVSIQQLAGQGVVVDLSAVFSNLQALPLVQMATSATLASQMARLQDDNRRGILVDDEVWATMASPAAASTLQERLKLCRKWGFWNILITHRLSDLHAQADTGTAAFKRAEGLLGDVQTRVVFRQATDQLAQTGELLRLNSEVLGILPRLARGRAVWTVAGRHAVVQHVIGSRELAFCDTDANMVA